MKDINKLITTIENLIRSTTIEQHDIDKSSMSAADKSLYSYLILGKKTAYYTVLEMLEELQKEI